ncbi:MAG: glycosyltransferase family 39 protein [Nanoarchaeota archaeon]|nr:glycosyltransferase family 39 protein [Nanoarchaeota archaeon]
MKKDLKLFLILLISFYFLIQSAFSFLSPVKYWDETIYTNLGRNLLIYHEYSFLHGFADFSSNWPLAGFRPPLLPIIISIVSIFSKEVFLLNFLGPIFSSLGVLGVFLLSKKLFDDKVAIYSSVLFAFFPLYLFWGFRILTDSLFLSLMLFAIYFFWVAFFEDSKKIKFPILFGVFSALAFLSRYSFIWFLLLFFLSLLFKNKNLKFLSDKKIWLGVLSFFVIIAPWFACNYLSYGSLFEFLRHANEASLRWGKQPALFYLVYFLKNFAIFIPFFAFGLYSRDKRYDNSKIFLSIWFVVIFLFSIFMGHKEERYLLPLLPAVCILSSFGLNKIKNYRNILFVIIVIYFSFFNFYTFYKSVNSYNSDEQVCFFNAMNFIKESNASYIVTEHFSPVYFHTLKNNLRVNNYTSIKETIESDYRNETVYYYLVEGDWFDLTKENEEVGKYLTFSCDKFKVFDLSYL